MLASLNFEKVLFLDVETVPLHASYDELNGRSKGLWDHKATFIGKEGESEEETYVRAGIYAEFGKVVCVSVGFIKYQESSKILRVRSFYGDNEQQLLEAFCSFLNKHYFPEEHLLCAHNGKEFDFPYLARRILINGLKLPRILDIAGKKPWEVRHLDTMQLWKFGDFKHYTSLDLLADIFDIPTPKDDIAGADICRVYWQDKDLPRIVEYCQKDVVTIAQLLLRFRGETLIDDECITIVG